jgi:hypothetical protein
LEIVSTDAAIQIDRNHTHRSNDNWPRWETLEFLPNVMRESAPQWLKQDPEIF